MSKKEVRDLKIKINNARTIGKYFTKDEVEFLQSLFESVNEGKGSELATKTIADLRKKFRKLNDAELEEFMKDLAYAFNLQTK